MACSPEIEPKARHSRIAGLYDKGRMLECGVSRYLTSSGRTYQV